MGITITVVAKILVDGIEVTDLAQPELEPQAERLCVWNGCKTICGNCPNFDTAPLQRKPYKQEP